MNEEQTTAETTVPVSESSSEASESSETSVLLEVTDTTETSAPAEEPGATTEVVDVYFCDQLQFYDMMYNSFEEYRLDNTDQNELIVSDMNRIAAEVEEYQMSSMILQMLTCGLIGIIIGVCLVNIFKKR